MYPLYSSHSNRRNDTHASGNVGCGRTVKREHTGAFTWHFYYPFNGFTFFFSVYILLLLSLILSSLLQSCVNIYALNYKSRHFGKNRHELSLRLARNLMRSHCRSRASRYHSRPMILYCASRVSNTCSKQSARGSFMHRGKIKQLSPSVIFPLAPSGTRFAIDYKLVAKFISRMPPRRPIKGDFTSCSRFLSFF